MDTEPIPAQWDSICSPIAQYWRGMDILEREWKRTQGFGDRPDDIDALHEYLFWRMNSVIWACSAIEAFVNDEGVAWLGERFYKRNVERLTIVQKINVLYAMKYRRRLNLDAGTLKPVRRLFDLRNRFVHPKAHEGSGGDARRERLDNMTPEELRRTFWSVASLFEPAGVGEKDEQSDGADQDSSSPPQPNMNRPGPER